MARDIQVIKATPSISAAFKTRVLVSALSTPFVSAILLSQRLPFPAFHFAKLNDDRSARNRR